MNNESKIILQKTTIIGQIPLFSELSPEDIELVATSAEFIEYKKDDLIYKEGDPACAFYCVISGRAKIYITHKRRAETLEYLHRGSYFGIISLLTGGGHSVTAQVVNDALFLRIQKDKFDKILKKIPKLAIHFSSTLSRRLKRKDLGPKTIFESTIISVYSVVKNIGRTLYAINLAVSLAKETKKKVILLDISSGGEDISNFLKLKNNSPVFELKTVFFAEQKVKRSIVRHESGIHLLNISHDSDEVRDTNQIASLLSCLTNEYHYVIVDLPIKMDEAVLKSLTQSDVIHLLTDVKADSIVSTNKLTQILQKVIKDADSKIKLIVSELRGKIDNFDAFSCKVYATLPNIKTDPQPKSDTNLFVLDMPQCDYARTIRRISRGVGGVLVGLVLGSGAALGLAHIGVIRVLEEEGIPIDVVAGSSMGASIAAFWATGKSSNQMEKIVYTSRKKISLLSLRDLIFPASGLISDRRIMNLLSSYLGEKTFRDIKLPLKIVAVGFENREVVVLDSGKLIDAVRASISIPGIFKPKKKDGIHLIDGGILDPVPVSVLMRMGVKKIIAVNTLPSPSDIQRGFDIQQKELKEKEDKIAKANIIVRMFYRTYKRIRYMFAPNILDIIVGSMQSMQYTIAEQSCRQADVYIHPDTAGLNWSDFYSVRKAIKKGEEATAEALEEIKQFIL